MPRLPRTVILLVLACLLLAAHAALFHHVVDDAFISFRYLRNALAGEGFVFNLGERVEGYTNFLWLAVLAPGAALGFDPPRLAQVLGVLCMGLAVGFRGRLVAITGGSQRQALSAVVLLCLSGPVAYWAGGGLETGLYCLLLMLFLGLVWWRRPWDAIAAGLVGALLCMTRPDGVVYVAAAVVWYLVRGRPEQPFRVRVRACVLLLVAFGITYGSYFSWRWNYYNTLLPNTFYAKVGGGTAALPRGAGYLLSFAAFSGIGALLCIGTGLATFRRRAADASPHLVPHAFNALVALLSLAGIVFVLMVGGDQLAMFRFMVPVVLLAGPSIWVLVTGGRPERPGLGVIVFCAVIVLVPSFLGPMQRRVVQSERPADADRVRIGQWLKSTQPAARTIALVPVGIVPYFSELPTLDLVGLTDPHIARAPVPGVGTGAPGHERYDADYVLRRRPDFVFLGACLLWEQPLGTAELEDYVRRYAQLVPAVGALLDHPEFRAQYSARALPIAGRYAHVWVRRGLEPDG